MFKLVLSLICIGWTPFSTAAVVIIQNANESWAEKRTTLQDYKDFFVRAFSLLLSLSKVESQTDAILKHFNAKKKQQQKQQQQIQCDFVVFIFLFCFRRFAALQQKQQQKEQQK